MYQPFFISFVRLSVLLAILLFSMSSSGAETAVQDSTGITESVSTPDASGGNDSEATRLPGSSWGSETGESGNRTVSSGDEKKRVRKEQPEESRQKGSEDQAVAEEDDDDDDCVDSCLGGILAGLFMSSSKEKDEDEENHYVPQTALRDTFPEGTYGTVADQYAPTNTYEPEPERVITPNDFSLVLDISWWKSGPSEVWEEYKDGGVRIGADGYFLLGETFELGIGVGYSYARGYPLYEYETSTTLESPEQSQLDIFDTGLRVGAIHNLSPKGPFLRWGLGPRLFWVKETADLLVYSLPDMEYQGQETVSLDKWRLGGDLVFSMLWPTSDSVLFGFSTRVFVISWDSDYEKALTLDYIGKKALVGFNIGLAVHFNGF
jgi:hypothetical protein